MQTPVRWFVHWHERWRTAWEGRRERLRRTAAGEVVVRAVDLQLTSRATVLSTQQVACLAPLAVGIMAMVHPSTRGNVGGMVGHLLGLDEPATRSLVAIFSPTNQIATSTGVIGLLFLIGWSSSVPGYTQRLLEDIWGLEGRGLASSIPAQVNWFIGFMLGAVLIGNMPFIFFHLGLPGRRSAPLVVLATLTLAMLTLQLWSNFHLLGRRVPMRQLVWGAACSTLLVDLVLVGMHMFASSMITETVQQFGLVGITFLAQASAVLVAMAMVFGELVGAELAGRLAGNASPGALL